MVKFIENKDGFEELRRTPDIERRLHDEALKVQARVQGNPGLWVAGISQGLSRSRGYVVTGDIDSVINESYHHSLQRALGG